MELIFEYGFEYNNFKYGWFEEKLYRLPSNSSNKTYGLKKLELIEIGRQYGYRIKRSKFTVAQLKEKTKAIEKVTIKIIEHKDIPS